MIERLSIFIETEGVSVRAFESSIGASNGLIRKAIANNTDIQSKWISAIAENYPQINLDWLLSGKGEMLKNYERNSSLVLTEPKSSKTDRVVPYAALKEAQEALKNAQESLKFAEQRETRLVEEIEELKKMLVDLKTTVRTLSAKVEGYEGSKTA